VHYGDFGIVAPQRTPSASSSAQCYALPINAKAGALFGTFFKPAGRSPKVEDAVRLILQLWSEPRITLHGRCFCVETRSSNRSRTEGTR
jgi:hypothetical protein